MAGKAQALGLVIDPVFLAKHSNLAARYSLDLLHDSHTGIFLLTPPRPRVLPTGRGARQQRSHPLPEYRQLCTL